MRLKGIFVIGQYHHHEDPQPFVNQTAQDAQNKTLLGRSLDMTDVTYQTSFGHNNHQPFQNQTTAKVHSKTLQPPYLNVTTPTSVPETPYLDTAAPASLSETLYLNETTSVDIPETPSSTPTPIGSPINSMPASLPGAASSILTEFPTPSPSSECKRPSPVNPIGFKVSKSALDHKIQVVDQKITYFKKQVEIAEEDITRMYKLTGAEHNAITDEGTNLLLNVAKGHKFPC
jgi:hypothetical protein